jgi:hypothetical protein
MFIHPLPLSAWMSRSASVAFVNGILSKKYCLKRIMMEDDGDYERKEFIGWIFFRGKIYRI